MSPSLHFASFSIAQPSTTGSSIGTCTDTFQVGGSINKVPTICGDIGHHSKEKKTRKFVIKYNN